MSSWVFGPAITSSKAEIWPLLSFAPCLSAANSLLGLPPLEAAKRPLVLALFSFKPKTVVPVRRRLSCAAKIESLRSPKSLLSTLDCSSSWATLSTSLATAAISALASLCSLEVASAPKPNLPSAAESAPSAKELVLEPVSALVSVAARCAAAGFWTKDSILAEAAAKAAILSLWKSCAISRTSVPSSRGIARDT